MITGVGYNLRAVNSTLKKPNSITANYSQNISKPVSFKGEKITEIPEDWGIYKDVISTPGRITVIEDLGSNRHLYIQAISNPENRANPEDIKEYIKTNPDKGLVYCVKTSQYIPCCYEASAPSELVYEDLGVLYTEKDGTLTYYPNSETGSFIDIGKDDYSKMIFHPKDERILLGLLKDKRYKEFRQYLNKNHVDISKSSDAVQKLIIDYYISVGLREKALRLCPERAEYINDAAKKAKPDYKKTVNDYLAEKNFRGALSLGKENLPYPFKTETDDTLNQVADYLENPKEFDEYQKDLHRRARDYIYGPLEEFTDNERVQIGMLTLGLSEIGNFAVKKIKLIYNEHEANKTIAQIENLIKEAKRIMQQAEENQPW